MYFGAQETYSKLVLKVYRPIMCSYTISDTVIVISQF